MKNYESWGSNKEKFLSYVIDNLNWQIHFHSDFEICYILDGQINIMIDNTMYNLKKDDGVIIFPRQLHSYETVGMSKMHIITFAHDLIPEFTSKYNNLIPENNYIEDLGKYKDLFMPENIFKIKGLLYSVLGQLTEHTSFKYSSSDEETILIHRVLNFIEENFNTECSLKNAAETLSYDYTYISRTFKQFMRMSYTEYLNRYKINHAVYLLCTEKNIPIQTVSELCGYESLCSFNRNFKDFTGSTPRDIKKRDYIKHIHI